MRTIRQGILNMLGLAVTLGAVCAPVCAPAGGQVAGWGGSGNDQTIMPQGLDSIKAVADGGYHRLALKADGRVLAWGSSSFGEGVVPADLSRVTAIGAGWNFNLVLQADGTVRAWGRNALGQTNVPSGLGHVIAIAAGNNHSLALQEDGTVVAWGYNEYGQATVPPGLSNVIAIAASREQSMALKADGTVTAWGQSGAARTNVPPGLAHVKAIACGWGFSLALKSDGTVVGWGDNTYGQTSVPPGLSNVMAISAGSSHCLALKSDGTIVAWGDSLQGANNVPALLTNATAIAAGHLHSLALMFEGPPQILQGPTNQTVAWGTNLTLALSVTGWEPLSCQWFFKGTALQNNARISGATTAVLTIAPLQFSDTGTYTLLISNALGSVISSNIAITVVGPPVITYQPLAWTVGAGADVSLGVVAEGPGPLTYQWRFDGTPLAGATRTLLSLTNVQPAHSGAYSVVVSNAYGSVQSLAALCTVTNRAPYVLRQPANQTAPLGGCATLSVSVRGSLPLSYQWRFNGNDIAGATESALTLTRLRYEQNGFYNAVVRNAFGDLISAKASLSVVQACAWGDTGGHVGSYDTAYFSSPYVPTNAPPELTNLVTLAAGSVHVLALKPEGRVATWMSASLVAPYNSVTNIPASVSNVVAIAAAETYNLALRSNGTVVVWGYNPYWPSLTNLPTGLTNVMAIAAGGAHCLALKSNGTVTAWGYPLSINVPHGLSNVIAIAAGLQYSLALRQDGTVTGWGGSPGFPMMVPPGLSNIIAISAGYDQNRALRADGTVVEWGYPAPVPPSAQAGFTNVAALAAGGQRCFALRADGSVVLSGSNAPPVPAGLSNVIAIAAGGPGYSPIRGTDGTLPGFFVALVGNGSPAMTLQPASQTATRGALVRLHARAVGVQPMSYQWQVNGQDLAGATNGSLSLTNVQGANGGAYRLVAANALGRATSSTATVTIPYPATLAAALNAPSLPWSTGLSNTAWFAQNRVTHDGEGAAQSGTISHNQQSYLQTTVTGPGTLRFWWKVSSEEGFDLLQCYQDGSSNLLASISGEAGWEQKTFLIPGGSHTLKWLYSKDTTVSDGQDAAWVDQVNFVPSPPIILTQPIGLSIPAGTDASLEVVADGALTYQWLKAGLDVAGATQSRLVLANVGRSNAGVYAVRVANAVGNVLSSNATVWVRVPQRLCVPVLLPDGSLNFRSGAADGGSVRAEDLTGFEAQASTNLTGWLTLTNALSWTNGSLWLRDPDRTNSPRRFYRVVEH